MKHLKSTIKMNKIVSGLFFHTNSVDTYYTFVNYENKYIEMEIATCDGLYDTYFSYQYEYKNNRDSVGYVCDTYENFMKNDVLRMLYAFSMVLSKPGPCLNTRIIWKCMYLSRQYEKFDEEPYYDLEQFVEPLYDMRSTDGTYISELKFNKLFDLICDMLEDHSTKLEIDIKNLENDIKYQDDISEITFLLDSKMNIPSNVVETIGKYM